MKPLRFLGFAIPVGLLAPLAQAAPALVAPAPAEALPFVAAPSAAAENANSDAPAQSGPEQHEPAGPPRSEWRNNTPPDRVDHHEQAQSIVEVAPAPDTDDNQDNAPAMYDQAAAPPDDSYGNPDASTDTAHYSIDDLAQAAASLDEPYGPTHFSMDAIGGF
jgi:hypothetical protein